MKFVSISKKMLLLILFVVFISDIKYINSASPIRLSEAYKMQPLNNKRFITKHYFKQNFCLNTRYNIIEPPAKIQNLHLPGNETRNGVTGRTRADKLHGKIVRSLRFYNITSAVEKKYGIPHNLLLAMIMLESGGMELLPNSADDGGIGLCHMQPKLASMFGLQTMDNCNDLRSKKHGRKLREMIRIFNYETRELIEIDDRFHPLLNIDAVARMLMYYKSNLKDNKTSWKMAVSSYGGLDKYPIYYNIIYKFKKMLDDKELLYQVKEHFNELNQELTINNENANFNSYLQYCWNMNKNYGLTDYITNYHPI